MEEKEKNVGSRVVRDNLIWVACDATGQWWAPGLCYHHWPHLGPWPCSSRWEAGAGEGLLLSKVRQMSLVWPATWDHVDN